MEITFTEFIKDNAIILIPVLMIIGRIVKTIKIIPNKFIPLILLVLGCLGGMLLLGWNVESAFQGILCSGMAVFSHQTYKQLTEKESETIIYGGTIEVDKDAGLYHFKFDKDIEEAADDGSITFSVKETKINNEGE